MKKAIIIEDEEMGRDYLAGLVRDYCPQVEIVAFAENITEGKAAIIAHKPDLVFLDIQMPHGSGFDLLESLEEINFHLIFTTAYDNYAVKAFEFAAVDYLLKPISPDRLIKAIERTTQRNKMSTQSVRAFLDSYYQSPSARVSFPTEHGLDFIDVDTITRCEGESSYTRIFFIEGKPLLVSKNLKEVEQMLNGRGFFRIHHSHLINLSQVSRYIKNDGGYVIMKDGTEVQISRRKKTAFLKWFTD